MSAPPLTLGALVRNLLDRLDSEVEAAYVAAGLAWRPRYTPILRGLLRNGPTSIKTLAQGIGVSHSAASQTVSQMAREGLVILKPGIDGRERIVVPTAKTDDMLPALERQWAATNSAAAQLDAELSFPVSAALAEAIAALDRRPFGERIRAAAETLIASE
jgi:DNA-binding MarR family transcriptional regulator